MSDHEDGPIEQAPQMLNLSPLTFDDLVAITRQTRVPRPQPARAPIAGDVWRLRWDDDSALVVILSLTKSTAHVAPVTFEVSSIESGRLPRLDQYPVYVAWAKGAPVPAITLDALFGMLPAQAAPPVDPENFDTLELDRNLADELSAFTAARIGGEGDGSLPGLLKASSVPPSQLVAELNIPINVALGIGRGKKPVTPAQAKQLARLLTVPEQEILRGNPKLPDELASDLQEWRHRNQLRRFATQQDLSDSEALSTAAYALLPTAARHTGGQEAGWHLRIDRYFESEGIHGE